MKYLVDPYAFTIAHRRLAWQFRLSVGLVISLSAVVILEATAISSLIPLQRLEIGLVRVDPITEKTLQVDPSSLVKILPITRTTPGYDLLIESFVRRYVKMLLEIDSVSQDDRMMEANLYSDEVYWKQFVSEREKEIKDAIDNGLSRTVIVESADRISVRDNISRYAVDLVQQDYSENKLIDSKKLRAYVAVTARPQTVRPSEKFENPAGFRVLSVSLKVRGNS
ncbi:MAG: type IV secretion system protein [Rhodospirillaceae bacterium]|nr:type IV secretion system protein [Rhodospirillaceae bacterium]